MEAEEGGGGIGEFAAGGVFDETPIEVEAGPGLAVDLDVGFNSVRGAFDENDAATVPCGEGRFEAFEDAGVCGFARGDAVDDYEGFVVNRWWAFVATEIEETAVGGDAGEAAIEDVVELTVEARWRVFLVEQRKGDHDLWLVWK